MVLTVHHIAIGQSERIIWLCEELQIPYELVIHQRSLEPPKSLEPLNPLRQAPVIQDGDVTLCESGAIVEYMLQKYGNGRLSKSPDDKDYPKYLYWLHFANGTLQPNIVWNLMLWMSGVAQSAPMSKVARARLDSYLKLIDKHFSDPENVYFVGQDFTAADIMNFFSLTTMRSMYPLDLTPYPHIVAYLKRTAERKHYRTAHEKGDPGLPYMLSAEPPQSVAYFATSSGIIGSILMPIRMIVRILGGLFKAGPPAQEKED